MAVLPLTEVASAGPIQPDAAQPPTNAALLLESFTVEAPDEAMQGRARWVGEQSRIALDHAIEFQKLAPFFLWGALGELQWALRARPRLKLISAAVALALITAILIFVPADFTLEASGSLQPKLSRQIFARIDGVVENVLVDHGSAVRPDQTLLELRSPDLEYRVSGVLGELQTTAKKLAAIKTNRLDKGPGTLAERTRYNEATAEESELSEWLGSLERQYKMLLDQKQDLHVRAPIQGVVTTWNVVESLKSKPVSRGEILLTVADLDGPWELEIQMPESRVGHLLTAQKNAAEVPLDVVFMLATEPNNRYGGKVTEVTLSAEPGKDQENTVLVKVGFDSSAVPLLRPGASVTARVFCGRKSLGFVWFHEIGEFIQSRILFRI